MATKVSEVAKIVEELGMTVEQLIDAIERIDNTMRTLSSGRLNRRAILLLVSDRARMGMGDVEKVFDALEGLKAAFIKDEKK